jgi:ribonuclease Z
MKPYFHPQLVNGTGGDPALYVEFLFERRALLFDLGELAALAPRKLLRVTQVFVSHTHMDHFGGLDRLVRVCLGRPSTVHLFGPQGFIDRVEHRLASYTWNLVERYETDFTLLVSEVGSDGPLPTARFRCRGAFRREPREPLPRAADAIHAEAAFRVRAAVLDHKVPCLAFALEEAVHVNIWKNRLEALGLPTGAWLRELKAAVLRGDPDQRPVRAWWRAAGATRERWFTLGELRRELVRTVTGQKLAYVVDAAYHPENARRIVALAGGADTLFIEATFLDADAALGAEKAHLTAAQAGTLARAAGVKHLVPFHFSARYPGREAELVAEAEVAFRGAN